MPQKAIKISVLLASTAILSNLGCQQDDSNKTSAQAEGDLNDLLYDFVLRERTKIGRELTRQVGPLVLASAISSTADGRIGTLNVIGTIDAWQTLIEEGFDKAWEEGMTPQQRREKHRVQQKVMPLNILGWPESP